MAAGRELEQRIEHAIARFAAENACDPNQLLDESGQPRPKELLSAERLAKCIAGLTEHPSSELRLAAHCQHLCRWKIPRPSFPAGRSGYLQWRKTLAKFHAEQAATILRELGFDETTIAGVRRINLKQDLKGNPDAQTMEDALCLCFLKYELTAFAGERADEQLLEILRKTWRKMSERGRRLALQLRFDSRLQGLLSRALGSNPGAL